MLDPSGVGRERTARVQIITASLKRIFMLCRLWEIPFAAPQLIYAAPVLFDNKKTAVVQALGTPSKAPQSWFTWPAQGCLWTPLRCPC